MFRRNALWIVSVAAVLVCLGGMRPHARAAGEGKPPSTRAHKPAKRKLKTYESRYYVIHTDLGDDIAAEASQRMTAMATEYYNRTKGFGGVIRRKLPIYLYASADDYRTAGGLPGSAGQFSSARGGVLMALAGRHPSPSLWHTVQHEGFHQFAHMVIGGRLPAWLDEGLAEYFGQGIWTGDGFVVGTIAQAKLDSIRRYIRKDRLTNFKDFLAMTGRQWKDAFAKAGKGDAGAERVKINYAQAWSMVQFLAHADDGKYRQSFSAFIADIANGKNWQAAFQSRFGKSVETFVQKYRDWWLSLPDNPTRDLYIQAEAATMTSYLARAVSQAQRFDDAEAFLRAAKAGTLKSNPAQKLPTSLLDRALVNIRGWDRGWRIDNAQSARLPRLVLAWPDGTTFTGTFTVADGKCANVKLTVTPPKPASSPGTKGITEEDKKKRKDKRG